MGSTAYQLVDFACEMILGSGKLPLRVHRGDRDAGRISPQALCQSTIYRQIPNGSASDDSTLTLD